MQMSADVLGYGSQTLTVMRKRTWSSSLQTVRFTDMKMETQRREIS